MDIKYAIGIDLGGTFIKFALVNQDGEKITEGITPTNAVGGREEVIENIVAAIEKLLRYDPALKSKILGIGLGTPGIVEDGVVIGGAENLPDWCDLPLGKILQEKFSLPVFMDNDANLMGLGEIHYGAAKDATDVIFLTVGTGIGGAMYLNGSLYSGFRNRGAEIGHMIIKSNGKQCECGAKGCLEAYASTTALVNDYKSRVDVEKFDTCIDGRYIVGKYKENDPIAIEVLEQHWDYLSDGIAGLINVFAPQNIVIGGGISEAGDFYFESLCLSTFKKTMQETSQFTTIVPAKLGNQAGIYGAVSLVFANRL